MRRLLAIVGLSGVVHVGLLLGLCAAAQESDPPEAPSPTIEEILAEWKEPASRPASGVAEWIVEHQNRSPRFGPFSPSHEPEDSSLPETLRVHFDERGVRIESRCLPPYGIAELRSSSGSAATSSTFNQNSFQLALSNHFQIGQWERKSPRPYLMIRNADRELHYWDKDEEGFPCGAIYPLKNASSLFVLSNASLVADALALSWHWQSLGQGDSSANNLHLVPDRPIVRGKECLAIEERLDDGVVRRYWIDPDRKDLIRRCTILSGENSPRRQYDFEYTDDEQQTGLPHRLRILQLTAAGMVHDEVVLTRQSFEADVPLEEEIFAWTFPPETLVTDFASGVQYLLQQDGQKRVVVIGDILEGRSYEDLRMSGELPASANTSLQRSNVDVVRFAVNLITWPWILLTLPGVLIAYSVVVASWRRLGRGSAGIPVVAEAGEDERD